VYVKGGETTGKKVPRSAAAGEIKSGFTSRIGIGPRRVCRVPTSRAQTYRRPRAQDLADAMTIVQQHPTCELHARSASKSAAHPALDALDAPEEHDGGLDANPVVASAEFVLKVRPRPRRADCNRSDPTDAANGSRPRRRCRRRARLPLRQSLISPSF
jgi:hypothetical protein